VNYTRNECKFQVLQLLGREEEAVFFAVFHKITRSQTPAGHTPKADNFPGDQCLFLKILKN
jgi:hypothetical protein